jgi:thymidylate synthase (FAD)
MIKLLNHGHVRLVDSMGTDIDIVRAARQSYDAAWRAGEDEGSDKKLLRYLIKNGHTTPFEMVQLKFEVKAPIFVFRQWHRHRTWSFNEMSARYTELPEEYYVPELENITTQSTSSKQARTTEQHPDAYLFRGVMETHNHVAFEQYKFLLHHGCPRELARSVLPMGTYSSMFASIDLHNLIGFLKLRLHEHAQYEIRVYAEAMKELIRPIVPVTMEILDE